MWFRTALLALVLLAALAPPAAASGDQPVVLGARGGLVARAPDRLGPVIADGRGGWFGVRRTTGTGTRRELVRIGRDGRLDRSWSRRAARGWRIESAPVRLALFAGDSGTVPRLAVAGRFRLGARRFTGVLLLDARNGRLLPAPRVRLDRNVTALAVGGRRLFVGFVPLGQRAASCLAAFDVGTGRALPGWRADLRWSYGYGCAEQLAVHGDRLFVAGGFIRPGDPRRRGVVALDAGTGAVDPGFRTRVSGNAGQVLAIAVRHGRVYLGGNFERVNGVPRRGLAAVDARSGRVIRAWRADLRAVTLDGPGAVLTLAALDRGVVAGGAFHVVRGQRRNGLALLDARTARVLPAWDVRGPRAVVGEATASGGRVLLTARVTHVVEVIAPTRPASLTLARLGGRLRIPLSVSAAARVAVELRARLASCGEDEYGHRCRGPLVRRVVVRFTYASTRAVALDLAGVPPGAYFLRFAVAGQRPPLDQPLDLVP